MKHPTVSNNELHLLCQMSATRVHETSKPNHSRIIQIVQPSSLHKAGFAYKGQTALVTLNKYGKAIYYEIPIKYGDLPLHAQYYISKHFGLHPSGTVTKIIDSVGLVQYQAEINGKKLLFNSSGKRL